MLRKLGSIGMALDEHVLVLMPADFLLHHHIQCLAECELRYAASIAGRQPGCWDMAHWQHVLQVLGVRITKGLGFYIKSISEAGKRERAALTALNEQKDEMHREQQEAMKAAIANIQLQQSTKLTAMQQQHAQDLEAFASNCSAASEPVWTLTMPL